MAKIPTIDMLGGLKMPMIGLGTWQASDETELEKALDVALEAGYRHIDTAYVYGNEKVIGRVLKKWFDSGKLKREDIFVTTKLPMCGVHADRVEMFMKASLENLQLDYVDLYLIHFPVGVNYVPGELSPPFDVLVVDTSDHLDIWKKMEEQVDAGRAKTIGISNFNLKQVDRILKNSRIKPACLQVELHVSLQQKELVDFCQKNNVVVVAYSPLGSPGYNTFSARIGVEPKPLPNLLENPVVTKVAQKHNKKTSHVLLKFLIQKNIVPIPKSVTPSRIIDNLQIFDFKLDDDDMKELETLDMGEKARICDFLVFPKLQDHSEWPFPKAC